MSHNMGRLLFRFAIALWVGHSASAEIRVSEMTVSTEPPDAVIRPFETAVVKAEVYGFVPDGAGTPRARLEAGGVAFRLLDADGGWLSKPFAGPGTAALRLHPRGRPGPRIRLASRGFEDGMPDPGGMPALRDSVLFTSGGRAGVFRIEAKLDDQTAVATVRVDLRAPSSRPPERVSFQREHPAPDRHRKLAEHYAPYVAQETWFDPKADFLARFDFDGNWHGDDNWEATPAGSSQAYVYYAVMETSTHWFLVYNFFHPRDYAERCVAGTCHENDNEGLILTVRKDGSRFGRLQVMETLAHDRIFSYRADERVQDGAHRIAGEVEFHGRTHPVVFVESGGHGVFSSRDRHSGYSFDQDAFTGGTGVTYVYDGQAKRPRHANDRGVGYELLPIYEQWWQRAVEGAGRRDGTFDGDCVYRPLGDRPGTRYPIIPCSFLGRAKAVNRAKPFWGWFDVRTRSVLAAGQWGLDPAYAVSKTLHFPAEEPFSLDYLFNPFLVAVGSPR